jgi:hypothetical protein
MIRIFCNTFSRQKIPLTPSTAGSFCGDIVSSPARCGLVLHGMKTTRFSCRSRLKRPAPRPAKDASRTLATTAFAEGPAIKARFPARGTGLFEITKVSVRRS